MERAEFFSIDGDGVMFSCTKLAGIVVSTAEFERGMFLCKADLVDLCVLKFYCWMKRRFTL